MNFTSGETRMILKGNALTGGLGDGSVVLDSRRVRPLWFDGRFLSARDLIREGDSFLQRLADLGQAAGFGVVRGLQVTLPAKQLDNETLLVAAGHGLTPAGELVMLPNALTIRLSDLPTEEKLDVSFGLSEAPKDPARTRTGLYVLGLRPVEFTANPISSYPTSIQGPRTTHDGDIVEATAVTLVPYPDPAGLQDGSQRRAAVAKQVFLNGAPGALATSVLPLAMVSIQRGVIEWVDQYMVRRDSGPEYSGIRFGLADPAAQQAFLLQYDSQLQEIVAARAGGPAVSFTASDYFRALPPAGRFPAACINVTNFSQVYFPQQMDVRLSIIPEDELPALLEDSLSLPPIDLTLSQDAYADMAVFALVPVPRNDFAGLRDSLTPVPLAPTLPQVISFRKPGALLRLYTGALAPAPAPAAPADNAGWNQVLPGTLKYAFYIRRRSVPVFVDFETGPQG